MDITGDLSQWVAPAHRTKSSLPRVVAKSYVGGLESLRGDPFQILRLLLNVLGMPLHSGNMSLPPTSTGPPVNI